MAFHGFPDKNGDRWAWERAWARQLAAQFNSSFSCPRLLDNPGMRHLLDTVGLDEQTTFSMFRIRDAVCEVQRDLADTAVKALAQEDFEKKWSLLSKKAREKLILDGIHHACCASGEMESQRSWCPDVTVEALEVGKGRGYIKMLKQLLPPDAVSPTSSDLLVVPHPAVDALLHITPAEAQNSAYKYQVDSTRILRMYFMSLVVLNVILGFYGASEKYSQPVKAQTSRDVSRKLIQATTAMVGKDIAKQWSKDVKVLQSDQHNICCFCQKPPVSGTSLKRCSKCKSIGRIVHYCSRDCQEADWKQGRNGRTHKQICGKPLQGLLVMDGKDVVNDSMDQDLPLFDVPPLAPGFRRSAALLHQINFLIKPPFDNYVIMRPGQAEDVGISIPDLYDQAEFLVMRRRALQCADPGAVHVMYSMLLSAASRVGVTHDQLRQQLENEYELSIVPDADTPLESSTEEERTRALYFACTNQAARLPPDEREGWLERTFHSTNGQSRTDPGLRDLNSSNYGVSESHIQTNQIPEPAPDSSLCKHSPSKSEEGTLGNEEPLSGILHIAPDTDPSPSTSSHAILQSTSKENSYAPKLIAPIPPAWPLLPVLILRPLKRGVTAASCLVSNYKRNIEARYPPFTAPAGRISELTILVVAVLTRWVVRVVWRLLRVLYRTVDRSLNFAVASFFWLIRFWEAL